VACIRKMVVVSLLTKTGLIGSNPLAICAKTEPMDIPLTETTSDYAVKKKSLSSHKVNAEPAHHVVDNIHSLEESISLMRTGLIGA
jgi:hypothetical protein